MVEAPERTKPVDAGTSETLEMDSPAVSVGTFDSKTKVGPPAAQNERAVCSESGNATGKGNFRAEIDTSAPFESVKQAASRFGGFGFWKPFPNKLPETEYALDEVDIAKVEEQTAMLEKDLIVKEREALEVLKELESTKQTVEDLKLRLQKEMSEVEASSVRSKMDKHENLNVEEAERGKNEKAEECQQDISGGVGLYPSSAPGLILMELKQAKLNLTRTTSDIAEIRASVESYNKKLEKEKTSLEKTRERLISNSSKISCLELQINQTRMKLQVAKDTEISGSPMDISRELQKLNSEAEQFKKMGEVAKSEVVRAMSEIEETRSRIKTAEIRLVAAKKMKEAARAAEAVALAEIKAMSNFESSSGVPPQKPQVTLSSEEYSTLTSKAQEAEESSQKRVIDAMLEVDEANMSKMEILKRVEEATEEVKSSRKALEEALSRVEAANKGKLGVEEALRKWRSEHGQRRRSISNSTKFKNPHSSHRRRDSRLLDVNGLNMANNEAVPVLRPTLSIGQILSRKLLLTEEFGAGVQSGKGCTKQKDSLGQMLNKKSDVLPASRRVVGDSGCKQFPAKRKKFGLAKFSTILIKERKKKKPSPNLR